jgi:hypothetical protein
MYYDKQSVEISSRKFDELFRDRTYAQIATDKLSSGHLISTIWIGIDHNCSGMGPPIIFETMVFNPQDEDLDQIRYATLEEAEAGHKKIVMQFRKVIFKFGGSAKDRRKAKRALKEL